MDSAGARTIAETIGNQFHAVHDEMRTQVEGLDRKALNWKPHPEANSIAVLVFHTLGSEREMINAVRGIATDRDRAAEFEIEADAADLVALIELADGDLNDHIAALTAHDLTVPRPRGDRPPRPGLEWLVRNYGHAREHLAQIELTKQLYDAER
jgi:DinB superfamily